jgi:hypothetical protein
MLLLFGSRLQSLDELSQFVSASLNVVLEKHDSLFNGGDYFRSISGDQVILQPNNDGGPSDEHAEEDFPEYPILLYVTTDKKDLVLAQLANCRAEFTLLRESVL